MEARQPAAACVIQEVAPAPGRHGAPAAAGAKKRVHCGRCSRSADKKTVERRSACNTPICLYWSFKARVQPPGATKTLPVMLNIPAMLLDYLADTLVKLKIMLNFDVLYVKHQFSFVKYWGR